MPGEDHELIVESLLAWVGGELRLKASRERATGRIVFPPRTDDEALESVVLPSTGRLWSWTVQRFRPKSPPYAGEEAFQPYAVGYVQLHDLVIVEARLVDVPFDALAIDMPMRLRPLPFTFADGRVRTSFAFGPLEEAAR